jgi:hypothetical protein
MEENMMQQGTNQEGLEYLSTSGRPVPGSSLTNNPETPFPWEGPTQYVELEPAQDAIFLEITQPEAYHSLMDLIRNDLPIGNVAQIILRDGFQKGMWNPDLMVLLIEPVMYMLIGLAEKAGTHDYITYQDEQEEDGDDDEGSQLEGIEKAMEIAQERVVPKAKAGVLPKVIEDKLENFETPKQQSLLEKPEEAVQPKSLLVKGEE